MYSGWGHTKQYRKRIYRVNVNSYQAAPESCHPASKTGRQTEKASQTDRQPDSQIARQPDSQTEHKK